MQTVNQSTIKLFKSDKILTQGNLQIIACAGAGKTEFVSTRIAYLIAESLAKPENIVAFTFTERAAEELKFRIRGKIRELIGHQPDIGDLYVGTIHSFCYELLKEFVQGARGYDVLDEGMRYAFMNSIRNELQMDKLSEWLVESGVKKRYGMTNQTWVLSNFIRGVDIVREEMLPVEQVAASEAFIDSYGAYNAKLAERKFLDFSSMMSIAVKALEENKTILNQVRKRFTHITVDEYQDVNPIQEKLVNLLAGPNGNLCVVGDDDQSVYQWRGSTIENILTFRKRYKNVHTYNLPINYRSTGTIIELANKLIKRNKRRLPKEMQSSGKAAQKGDIYKLPFENQEDEIEFIVKRIKYLIGTEWVDQNGKARGLARSDIAILFRSVKYDGKPYLNALDEAGIPYAVSGVGGLFEALEVDVVFDILSFIGEFEKNWGEDEPIPDEESIYAKAKELFQLPQRRFFKTALQTLRDEVKERRRVSLQGLYGEILLLLGLDKDELHNDEHELRLYNLGRFSQAISDYEGTRTYCTYNDIKGFCWFIKHYAEASYDAGAGDDRTRFVNAIQVMTLHGTKGLGFPVVFMPYCVNKKPRQTEHGFLDPDKFDFSRYHGSTEDERRLFYVGMTRAKKYLYITTSHDPGYRKRKQDPSLFFGELDDKLCITAPIADPTRRARLKSVPAVEDYRFPTNYSELSDYLTCEYDYKMRYIYGFDPIIEQAIGYGRQIHNILDQLHKLAQENGRVPTEDEAADILKASFYLRYAAREQEQLLKRSAMKSILRYLGMWREDFSLSVKSERSFEMDVDNALITGTIDLLKRESTSEDILEVIDFKTGNKRTLDEQLSIQVQLYTYAAREALNLDVRKAYVHFLDDNKQQRVEILTTPKQLDLAMQTVSDAISGITSRRFKRNPRNRAVCVGCDWNKICPKKKR
jgi:DNA helicase II / ATP-dependent DNA helicase PcrA